MRTGAIVVVAVALALLASTGIVSAPQPATTGPQLGETSVGALGATVHTSVPNAIDPVNPTRIPIGDGNVTTSRPEVGWVYACNLLGGGGAGSTETLPWVNSTSNTWDSLTKVTSAGNVSWPTATFSVSLNGDQRVFTGNDLPIDHTTGVFPISASDPAYQYDHNPNSIEPQNFTFSLPADPTLAASPGCLPYGAIGILSDGVVLFNALDALNRDAMVHEVLDQQCDGHPDGQNVYHHHDIPSCILSRAVGANTSTLVGYAFDGYGIYAERDANGSLLTNANLDECHGRTSEVLWDGQMTVMYHYDATLEYPYTVGCFHGTPAQVQIGIHGASPTPSAGNGLVYVVVGAAVAGVVAATVVLLGRRK